MTNEGPSIHMHAVEIDDDGTDPLKKKEVVEALMKGFTEFTREKLFDYKYAMKLIDDMRKLNSMVDALVDKRKDELDGGFREYRFHLIAMLTATIAKRTNMVVFVGEPGAGEEEFDKAEEKPVPDNIKALMISFATPEMLTLIDVIGEVLSVRDDNPDMSPQEAADEFIRQKGFDPDNFTNSGPNTMENVPNDGIGDDY